MDQEDKYLQRRRLWGKSKHLAIKVECGGKIPQGYVVGTKGKNCFKISNLVNTGEEKGQ